MSDNLPCRVMVDLALHESGLRDRAPEAFDEFNEMHMRAVAPYDLAMPLQQVLMWRGLEHLPQELRDDLNKLYRACVERWRDL